MENVVVYSKADCGFCTAAKRLLEENNLLYTEISLDDEEARDLFVEANPTLYTVPQIFINGNLVDGGYTGLEDYVKAYNEQSVDPFNLFA